MLLIEHHLENLMRGYLASAAAITAGVPSTSTLPVIVAHERSEKKSPQLSIRFTRVQRSNVALAELAGEYAITCDDTSTDIATASAQMQKIRAFLADDDYLAAYLVALSIGDKEGWCLLNNTLGSDVEESREDDQHTVIMSRQTLMCRLGPVR